MTLSGLSSDTQEPIARPSKSSETNGRTPQVALVKQVRVEPRPVKPVRQPKTGALAWFAPPISSDTSNNISSDCAPKDESSEMSGPPGPFMTSTPARNS